MDVEPTLAELEAELAQFRCQCAADPDALFPRMAYVLGELSLCYRDQGRFPDALKAGREAADLFGEMAAQDDAFHKSHAVSLSNLSVRLQDCGDWREAASASRQAADAAQAVVGPEAAVIKISARLNQVSQLLELGEDDEARTVLHAVTDGIRSLGEGGSRDQARALYSHLRHQAAQSEAAGQGARAAMWRQALVRCHPDTPFPQWKATGGESRARALTVLALRKMEAGNPAALPVAEAAVAAWRGVGGNDDAHLAAALTVLASAREQGGDRDRAIDAASEAAALWRKMPSLAAESEGVVFADTLARLAGLLAAAGRFDEGAQVAEEGLQLCLSSVIKAGVANPTILAELEKTRALCLSARGG